MTSIDEYHILKSGSEEFLDSVQYQLENGYFTVGFSSFHRSLELIHGVEYPRTHSLKSLIEIIANATEEKCEVTARELLDTYIMGLALLEDACITSRYFSREYSRGGDHQASKGCEGGCKCNRKQLLRPLKEESRYSVIFRKSRKNTKCSAETRPGCQILLIRVCARRNFHSLQ